MNDEELRLAIKQAMEPWTDSMVDVFAKAYETKGKNLGLSPEDFVKSFSNMFMLLAQRTAGISIDNINELKSWREPNGK